MFRGAPTEPHKASAARLGIATDTRSRIQRARAHTCTARWHDFFAVAHRTPTIFHVKVNARNDVLVRRSFCPCSALHYDDANGTSTNCPSGFLLKGAEAAFNEGDAASEQRCILQILVLSSYDPGHSRAMLTTSFKKRRQEQARGRDIPHTAARCAQSGRAHRAGRRTPHCGGR